MKIKRYKKVNKNINFYINNFGFRQPYQLLVDGTFCFAALNNQVNIADNIPRYLHGETKLLTTQCAVMEMETLGSKLHGALLILKKYGIHKCGHEGKPVAGSKCLLSMLGNHNENHYIICTQDRDLQEKVRNIPGVPLLYLHIKTPNLEQPSEASEKFAKERLSGIGEIEKVAINKLKTEKGLLSQEDKPKKKRKKGPNPLSCKKRKKPGNLQNNNIKKKEGQPEIEKKKRKRIKIPQHVQEALLGLFCWTSFGIYFCCPFL
ncbi:unnamed protein product [Brassicogethes aeneus]|uniref:rRNA-processing protein UTP23 homolog n=1 Tax=Brassicogethes aeneus TaxID=1431903 RepID=A0A9P0B659_BRAAE|nr:unnamed protein product [Brassicogethes aeneus]